MNENISINNEKDINNDLFCFNHKPGENLESKDKNLINNYVYC